MARSLDGSPGGRRARNRRHGGPLKRRVTPPAFHQTEVNTGAHAGCPPHEPVGNLAVKRGSGLRKGQPYRIQDQSVVERPHGNAGVPLRGDRATPETVVKKMPVAASGAAVNHGQRSGGNVVSRSLPQNPMPTWGTAETSPLPLSKCPREMRNETEKSCQNSTILPSRHSRPQLTSIRAARGRAANGPRAECVANLMPGECLGSWLRYTAPRDAVILSRP